jgi:hypothetical protein
MGCLGRVIICNMSFATQDVVEHLIELCDDICSLYLCHQPSLMATMKARDHPDDVWQFRLQLWFGHHKVFMMQSNETPIG